MGRRIVYGIRAIIEVSDLAASFAACWQREFCCDLCGVEVPEWGRQETEKNTTQFKEKRGPGGTLSSDGETTSPEHGLCVYYIGVG